MAGRRAHIGTDRFSEFFESIPEESKSQGYWRVKRESFSESGTGGVVQAMLGFIPFNAQESYESLKARVKDQFGMTKGPGTYYAIPCDDRKRELKDVDMVKIELTEKEVPVANPGGQNGENGASSIGDPMKEVMATVKKTMKDNAELKAMKMQEKLLSRMAGDDDEEEDDVRENSDLMGGGGLQNMLMYKSLFEEKKPDKGDSEVKELLKELVRAQNQPKPDTEVKDLLKELVRNQHQQKPAIDPELKAILDKLMNDKQSEKQESTLQTIFAMQLKQAEERDRVRDAEMKAREEERREERRQREEQARLEREKFEAQIKERETRFAAEMEIRRQEMKSNEVGGKHAMTEQQALQLKMFDFLSNKKDNSLDSMKTILETLTGAGLSSMKTAQSAADAMINMASKIGRDDDKEEKKGGILDILQGLAPLAGSLLGPYANMDAQSKLLQQIGGSMGPGGLEQLLAGLGGMGMPKGPPPPPQGQYPPQQQQRQQRPPQQRPTVTEAPVPAPSVAPKASDRPQDNGGMAMIIAKVLKDNPEIKHMMLGNMQDKLGVDLFVDFLYDFDIAGVDKMIAMMPPQVLMQFVKGSCTPDEAKVIDANLQWFTDLKRIVLEEIKAEKEEEAVEDAIEDGVKKVVDAAPVAATPAPAAPAPAPTAALTPAPVAAPAAQA